MSTFIRLSSYSLLTLFLLWFTTSLSAQPCPSYNQTQSPVSRCSPGTFSLSLQGLNTNYASYAWYKKRADGTWELLLDEDDKYATDVLSQTTDFRVIATAENTSCTPNSRTFFFTALVGTPITVNAGPDENICASVAELQLSGSPGGGVWVGPGVSSNRFYPSGLTIGNTYAISYQISSNGCVYTDTKNITITGANVSAGAMTICKCTTEFPLTNSSPSGGVWSGNYVNSSSGTFDAFIAGPGNHPVTYSVTQNGCTVSKVTTINVYDTDCTTFPANASPSTICGTGTSFMSVSFPEGVDPHDYEVKWIDISNNQIISSQQFFPTPTLSSTKNYKVLITNKDDLCQKRQNATVLVIPPPNPISITTSGGEVPCTNGNTTISITNYDPSITYTWSYMNQNIVGDGTITIGEWAGKVNYRALQSNISLSSIPSGGSISVKGTRYHSQCGINQETTATRPVIILPPTDPGPSIINTTRFEPGALTLQIASPQQNVSYKWFNPSNMLIQSGSEYYVSNVQNSISNFVYVKQIDVDNCESLPTWVNLEVYSNPVIDFIGTSYIPLGGTTILQTDLYDSYLWKNSANEVIGTNRQLTISTKGDYSLEVTKNGSTGYASTRVKGHIDSQPLNYIIEDLPQLRVTDVDALESLPIGFKLQNVTYYDGLGRVMQQVATQSSTGKIDVVQPFLYDHFGRKSLEPLPISIDNTGRYKTNIINDDGVYQGEAASFYTGGNGNVASDESAFSKIIFEPSPLNRVIKQGAPGFAWQPDETDHSYTSSDHTIKFSYEFNTLDEVLIWDYEKPNSPDLNGVLSLGVSSNGSHYYNENQLYKNRTKDENNNEVIEYIDKEGRTILKKVQLTSTTYAETYYVYDVFGNLVIVLPPQAVAEILNSLN